MTTPTDPPEWALEEANKLLKWSRYRSQSQWREKIALALYAARRKGIEEREESTKAMHEAAPRPWKVIEEAALDYRPSIIETADGKSRVAMMYGGGPERANAILIVTAVNGHEGLVAERDRLRQQVEDLEADASNDYRKNLALKHDYVRLRHENKICRELITNVHYWISHDCSEMAVREIDAALARIREALGSDDMEEGKK